MENGTNWEKIKEGVRKYTWIMDNLHKTDVSKDREFQKAFNHFYRVRQKSKQFYEAFYEFIEKNKGNSITFRETLSYLYEKDGALYPSFSSKALATINPDMPVWDKIVCNIIGIQNPPTKLSLDERIEEANKSYENIISWYEEILKTGEGAKFVELFDMKIGKTNITPVKKIDFILWQTRT